VATSRSRAVNASAISGIVIATSFGGSLVVRNIAVTFYSSFRTQWSKLRLLGRYFCKPRCILATPFSYAVQDATVACFGLYDLLDWADGPPRSRAVNASPAMATLVAKVTSREWDVATLMAKGLSNKQVAQHLNLEEGTVKIHLHDIFTKLAVKKTEPYLL